MLGRVGRGVIDLCACCALTAPPNRCFVEISNTEDISRKTVFWISNKWGYTFGACLGSGNYFDPRENNLVGNVA